MKRICAILLALMLLFAASCSKEDAAPSPKEPTNTTNEQADTKNETDSSAKLPVGATLTETEQSMLGTWSVVYDMGQRFNFYEENVHPENEYLIDCKITFSFDTATYTRRVNYECDMEKFFDYRTQIYLERYAYNAKEQGVPFDPTNPNTIKNAYIEGHSVFTNLYWVFEGDYFRIHGFTPPLGTLSFEGDKMILSPYEGSVLKEPVVFTRIS